MHPVVALVFLPAPGKAVAVLNLDHVGQAVEVGQLDLDRIVQGGAGAEGEVRLPFGVPAGSAQFAARRAVETGRTGGQALLGVVPVAASLQGIEQIGRPVALHQAVDLGHAQGLDALLAQVAALAGQQALARVPAR
ncbi:hypothetical protein D3C78_1262730 [compost metagenome]